MGRGLLWIGLWLLCLCAGPQRASASGIDLRHTACIAVLPGTAAQAAIIGAAYRCGSDAPSASDGWIWLRLDTARLHTLPPGWHLLVDQTRFEQIAVLVEQTDHVSRIDLTAGGLHERWSPGGLMKFRMAPPGRDIRGLYLGFRRVDDLSLMRKIAAMPTSGVVAEDTRWFILMGLFAGALLSAFLYNIVIHAGRRYAFQRWYLAWVALAFAYGMVWTNMAALLVPALVGPIAVRLDFLLVGLMVGAGNMFFFSVIEEGILPRRLVRAGRLLATAGVVMGAMAAADTLFPPVLTDRLLNYVIAGTAVVVGLSCAIAVRRGSRVVWFYLIGWGPVICVFLMRLGRNLGWLPQSDHVDMATFAALAFEALLLSLAIADRFRMVRSELEIARRRRAVDLAEANALRQAAQTDYLTGLGNRAAFQHATRLMIDRGEPFTLFLIDMDFLKDANDRLGHAGGDALLQWVAAALSGIAHDTSHARVARVGGDEFALLLPGDSAREAVTINRIAMLQGHAWSYLDQERAISLSVGSARFPENASDLDQLYQNADLALYNAKRLGRGRHYRYDPLQRILRDLQIVFTSDADAALVRGEFCVHLQPIVTLPFGTISGYEALLRWNHPEHGLMLPERFADVLVAERIGLRIQEHVLDLALACLRDHRDLIPMLSVNFTAAQLAGPQAARRILNRLSHYDVSPSQLCIEVTESVMLERAADTVLASLRILHDAGVCITLDDFGTGYTSLVHLRQLPVDRIKIDRSFIGGIGAGDGGTLPIVRAIIGMARGLGKIVVAEGIETHAQAERLKLLGCHFGQGFLFGRAEPAPMPAEQRRDSVAN